MIYRHPRSPPDVIAGRAVLFPGEVVTIGDLTVTAPARTAFRWRSSGADGEELAESLAREAAETKEAAVACRETATVARTAAAAAEGGENEALYLAPVGAQTCGAAWLPQSARLEQLAREAEAAAVEAAAAAGSSGMQ